MRTPLSWMTRALGPGLCFLTLSASGNLAGWQAPEMPSEAEAARLERKIRAIEAADVPERTRLETVDVSELELESYALYEVTDQLPVRVDALDLEIRPGRVAATVDMFVEQGAARKAQPIVGPLFEGDHTVFFEGALEAHRGQGRFDLDSVRVDGIPVPVFLVKALLENMDEPLDLDAPFPTPLGIDSLVLENRFVRVTY